PAPDGSGRQGRRSRQEQLYVPAAGQDGRVGRRKVLLLRFREGRPAMKRTSAIHAFFETAAREPDRVALKRRISPGRWPSMTRSEYAREVRRKCQAIVSLSVQTAGRTAL